MQPFDSVDDVLSDISNGKMVIVTDTSPGKMKAISLWLHPRLLQRLLII